MVKRIAFGLLVSVSSEQWAGGDERFWRLAQALVAPYPKKTRRWIEGVLGRKKGLGF